jgi:hypothetical protein
VCHNPLPESTPQFMFRKCSGNANNINPNIEYRNPKQTRIIQSANSKLVWNIVYSDLEFVSDFGFRASYLFPPHVPEMFRREITSANPA